MKRALILAGTALSLLNACSDPGPDRPQYTRDANYRTVEAANAETWTNSVNGFSQSLEDELNLEKNYVISPFSIYTALSMIEYGANGDTLDQMQSTLHMDKDRQKAAKLNADLIYNLKLDGSHDYSKLNLANQVWAEKTLPLVDDFKSTMETVYEAPVMQADFVNNPNETVKAINSWANEVTDGTIPNAVDNDAFSDLTKVVLVNAIYFKAKWHYEFDKSQTTPRAFYSLDNVLSEIPMMHQETELRFYADSNFSAVVLPYKEQKFEMVIVLPHAIDGIRELSISPKMLDDILSSSYTDVNLTMPKFKIESEYPGKTLVDHIRSLGIINAFTPNTGGSIPTENPADFSNMTSEYVYITKVLQKAMIEVDEEGTTAAAVSAVESCWNCDEAAVSINFVADHPFKYYIVHHDSGAVLFSGEFHNK